MKRLRHPINSIREPFGKAGLTVAVCALVLALVGGAYAAGGLTKAQEKQVTKIAKKYAGKPGATGPAGAAGTNGTNGTNGKDGAPGAKGEQGIQGVPGTDGTDGTTGFTETLPEGKTETGNYSVAFQASGALQHFIGEISFNIPLFVTPNAETLEYEQTTSNCPGKVEEPKAEPGYLCVYELPLQNATFNKFLGLEHLLEDKASKFGALIEYNTTEEGPASAAGSWAVTEAE